MASSSSSTSLWLVVVLLVAVTSTLIGLFLKHTHTHTSAPMYIFMCLFVLSCSLFFFISRQNGDRGQKKYKKKKYIKFIYLKSFFQYLLSIFKNFQNRRFCFKIKYLSICIQCLIDSALFSAQKNYNFRHFYNKIFHFFFSNKIIVEMFETGGNDDFQEFIKPEPEQCAATISVHISEHQQFVD